MPTRLRTSLLALLLVAFVSMAWAQVPAAPQRLRFHVTLSPGVSKTASSGRLLILLSKSKGENDRLRPSDTDPSATWIAAKEVDALNPGATIELDPDDIAFPSGFSKLPKGDYYAMALLDVDHNAAYRLYTTGDLKSPVAELKSLDATNSAPVELTLDSRIPERKLETPAGTELLEFVSPSLSKFWGRPIHMRGAVVLPPNYKNSTSRYPTVYITPGFGADIFSVIAMSDVYAQEMKSGKLPFMIYVLLDESCPGGTHEFADSVNNGPWGHALTTELIPHLEKQYRMDARPSGRFLTGHSSGGWATLWLQTAYPKVFGGTWSTSPDPSDFRDFTGPDLVHGDNVYRRSDGSPFMLVRVDGKDVTSIEQYAKQERVLGTYGGQFASFEWVFSPRGPDGRPMQMFDRETGAIHPDVAKYWEEHYDIASLLRKNWPRIGPDLRGKIHVIVGTADTFHLDGPAHLLDKTLQQLGGNPKFTFLEGRTHFDLYRGGLEEQIAKEMYAVARPQKPKKAAAQGQ